MDLTAVILDWGTDGSTHNADVTGDGVVDVQDLTAVILAWGPCVQLSYPATFDECLERTGTDPASVIGCFELTNWW